MAYTWQDVISLALTDAGVLGQGQTASGFDTSNAITRLNWMLAQWRQQRYLVYVLQTIGVTCTGAQSYTVGPGGDYDLAVRPDKLESAFFRQLVQSQPSQLDYPLEILQAREDYNNIAMKQLTAFPSCIFYESSFPLGRIYPWPIPQANIYSVYISVKAIIDTVTPDTAGAEMVLPEEYFNAVYLSLAEALRMAYKLPPDPILMGMAEGARAIIRASNAQIPRLHMPPGIVRSGTYNPYSDQIG